MMEQQTPLVSCICITSHRITVLKRAIACFLEQDYPQKELVVSYPENDRLTRYVVSGLKETAAIRIVSIERPENQSLGEARNQAIGTAAGDYICTWDDDDWYHPQRISIQLDRLRKSPGFAACVLNQLILFDGNTGQAYLSFLYTWEGTLMAGKAVFKEYSYAQKSRGEDTKIVEHLDKQRLLLHLWDMPFLYVYVYHRSNTWNYGHYLSFVKKSEALGPDISLQVQNLII